MTSIEHVSAALLRGAGIGDDAARAVLDALWEQPSGTADTPVPPRRAGDERRYVRELGQRLHVVRRVRRRSSSDVCRLVDLRPVEVHD